MTTELSNDYRTTDIVLAACLKLRGHTLITIEKDIRTLKGTFVFSDVPKEFTLEYDLGKILVEPVAFNNIIKQLTTTVRRM